MRQVQIGALKVSRLCLGGNPFSGFSHQTAQRSREMIEYYTPARTKAALRTAEKAGINTLFARTDDNIHRIIREYRQEGGAIQWFAQVCGDKDQPQTWAYWLRAALDLGADGIYIHGGIADHWHANAMFDHFHQALEMMRPAAAVGFAGHRPEAHQWIRDNLEVDFQMCSHYNPTDRSANPDHQSVGERWPDEDRNKMLQTIAAIPTPVIHYKVLAGGNNPILPSFQVLGRAMRPNDVVCIGMYLKDDPHMIEKDIALFEEHVEAPSTQPPAPPS